LIVADVEPLSRMMSRRLFDVAVGKVTEWLVPAVLVELSMAC
jgi:hypothetical protein